MSQVPANPFAAPDGEPSDPGSVPTPPSDPGGSPYGQPEAGLPTYGTLTSGSDGPPAAEVPAWGTSTPVPPPYGPYGTPGGMYPPPYPYQTQKSSNGLAIASLVTGIVSFVLCWFAFIAAIAGLVMGIVALSQAKTGGSGRGMAIAGVATSGASLVLNALFVILGLVA